MGHNTARAVFDLGTAQTPRIRPTGKHDSKTIQVNVCHPLSLSLGYHVPGLQSEPILSPFNGLRDGKQRVWRGITYPATEVILTFQR